MALNIIVLIFILLLFVLIVPMVINLLARPLRKTGGVDDNESYDPYWIISSSNGINYTALMESIGVSPYPNTGDYIKNGELLRVNHPVTIPRRVALFLLHTNDEFGGVDPNAYNINSYVKNEHDALSIRGINNKFYLHQNLPEFVARSWPLDEFQFTDGVYILRPAHITACGGADIFVVTNADEFTEACRFYKKKIEQYQNSRSSTGRDYKILVSEYITDPLLLDGKKFHIRLHGITVSGECKFKILRRNGELLTAKFPYIKGDWLNKEIHDTHWRSTERDYFYPDDFPAQEYLPRLEKFLDDLEIGLSQYITCKSYPESTHSFNLYGLDIMVDASGKPYLIEVNSRPGMARRSAAGNQKTSQVMCAWIWENIQHFFKKKA